jgi:hypothetical protein
MRFFALPLLAAFAAAQNDTLPTPLPADLEALARRVEAAHHPQGPVARVTAFDGSLELHVHDAKQAQGGQVDVDVKYLEWHPAPNRTRHLIRYSIREATPPVECGRDKNGFWHLYQGEAINLTEADVQDRAAAERHTNLARQLVRFLEPGQVLRALTGPSPVRDEPFQMSRETPVACETVEGGLPAFPLLQQGGDDAPVHAKVLVEKATGRLLAIEVSPLVQGKPDVARTEVVRLNDLRPQDGFLVPRQLLHWQRGDDGRLRLASRAVLPRLTLRPNLSEEDFRRPTK